MGIALNRHQFTVEDFHFLYDQGKFKPDARLELIEGEIYEMSPIGSLHARCVKYLSHFLSQILAGTHIISVQDPIILNDFNQPQPDLAVLNYRDDFYKDGHPKASDILLVIEVADTTVQLDRSVKLPKYAAAGIPEAWLIDLPAEKVEIHAGLKDRSYASVKVYGRGEQAISETLPDVKFNVDDILG